MFRKSALAMAMLGALTTGNVVALGLGDIELKSALNQPLDAEVELLSATEAEMDELKVALGSSAAFSNAGIDRPLFLTKFRFDVTRNAEGKPVIHVHSRDVVREPFLDFLLEISWSRGRLLREFTVLVDPPVTMPAPAPVTQAPAVQSAPPVSTSAAAAPAQRRTHTAILPPVSVAPGEYGPTKRNDTLWKVAEHVRPGNDVSMEQTMLGLLRTNPEAFYKNNINNLKAGYILRVPSREEMTSISRAEASREARAQYDAWREQRALPPVRRESVAGTAAGAGEGVTTFAGQAESTSHLQLVAPEMSEAGAAGVGAAPEARMEAMQRDLMMANEAMEEQRRQSEEMSGRLQMLEEQISNMQRLIQLKDTELARLQSQAGAEAPMEMDSAVAGEEAPVADPAAEMPAGLEPMLADDVAGMPVAGEEMAVTDAAEMEVAETAAEAMIADAEAEARVAGEALAPETAEVEVPAAEVAEPVAETPESMVQAEAEPAMPETATTPGLVDRLMENPLWLGAGGVVLAMLAFFGLRRKRGVETEFQESILQASGADVAEDSDATVVASEPQSSGQASTDSSLLSEFAVSDMGAVRNEGEADPLAEADVYLAYGRYQQAEELIREALGNAPEHEELNLKLLEVFLAARNQPGFDEHAQAMLARMENSEDPVWEKVSEMGREMSPGNPMYQSGGAEIPAAPETDEADSLDESLDFNLGAESAETGLDAPLAETAEQEPVQETPEEDQGLDFDLDLSFEPGQAEAAENEPDSVAFTPDAGTDSGEPEVSPEPELNVDMDSVEPDAVVQQDNALDFDLEGFDVEAEAAEEPEGDGELADLDEVSTKLDLARAYIDMGDPDGARSILDEVLDEGDDSQKTEARGIMEQIS